MTNAELADLLEKPRVCCGSWCGHADGCPVPRALEAAGRLRDGIARPEAEREAIRRNVDETAAQLGGNGSPEDKAGGLLGWMSAAEDRMPRGDTPDELRRRLERAEAAALELERSRGRRGAQGD